MLLDRTAAASSVPPTGAGYRIPSTPPDFGRYLDAAFQFAPLVVLADFVAMGG